MERKVVSARELKTQLGSYLQQVRAGRTLIITHRGEPVAELRPLPSDDSSPSTLLKLFTKGTVTLPTRNGLPPFRPIRTRGAAVANAVRDDREDRYSSPAVCTCSARPASGFRSPHSTIA